VDVWVEAGNERRQVAAEKVARRERVKRQNEGQNKKSKRPGRLGRERLSGRAKT
jgi:hypothetical protein